MAALQIPDRYRAGLLVLARLSDMAFEEFLVAARLAPTALQSDQELLSALHPRVSLIQEDDLRKLIGTITSIYRLPTRYGISTTRIAKDLAETAILGVDNSSTISEEKIRSRVFTLLSVEAFEVIAHKADELRHESERTFLEARILTDIRPVFSETVTGSPMGMIVIHTLKLVTHDMSGHREFFVALDDNDISSLKKTLERAEEKAKNINDLLKSKGLPTILTGENDGN